MARLLGSSSSRLGLLALLLAGAAAQQALRGNSTTLGVEHRQLPPGQVSTKGGGMDGWIGWGWMGVLGGEQPGVFRVGVRVWTD